MKVFRYLALAGLLVCVFAYQQTLLAASVTQNFTFQVTGTTGTPSQAFALPAPTTSQGNYATGCSGGSCLLFDDHWTSPSLNLANWSPNIAVCNNGGAQNCGSIPGPYDYQYPLSGWCWSNANGCQDVSSYDYPYGIATNGPGLTHNALAKAADGSLAFGVKLYSTTVYPTASTNVISKSPYCTGTSGFTNCNFIYWTGAAITAGGLSCTAPPCFPATVNNVNAIIPVNGGMFQWRMKLDSGLQNGSYPIMECDAVGGSFAGTNTNANLEWGYTALTGPLHTVGLSINNGPVGDVSVNTGDDGVGSGDLTNWHKYALEWTGGSTHQWNYYIDGLLQTGSGVNEASVPTTGWNCKLVLGIAQNQTNGGFHTLWDAAHPGPFFMYVGDAQVYKKPGT